MKTISGLYFAGEVLDVDAYTVYITKQFFTGALAGNPQQIMKGIKIAIYNNGFEWNQPISFYHQH